MDLFPFVLEGCAGRPLPGEIRRPSGADGLIPVVLLQDFLLQRSWGFYPFLAEQLAERFLVVTFDPSSAGFAPDGQPDPEALRGYSFSTELEDLSRVVDALRRRLLPGSEAQAVGPGGATAPVALVGHTKGAALALVRAAEDPATAAVACLSAICTVSRLGPAQEEELERSGSLAVRLPGTDTEARLGRAFLEDLRERAVRYDLESLVRRLRIPLLFLHGEEDHCAGIEESETLYHWAHKDRSRLVILEKTGYSFGSHHPFDGPTKDLERAADVVRSFLWGSLVEEPAAAAGRGEPAEGVAGNSN